MRMRTRAKNYLYMYMCLYIYRDRLGGFNSRAQARQFVKDTGFSAAEVFLDPRCLNSKYMEEVGLAIHMHMGQYGS